MDYILEDVNSNGDSGLERPEKLEELPKDAPTTNATEPQD
jgi:hypothetical protein